MTTYIGKRMKRLEDPRFIAGQATFIDDIRLPDMLHACVVRSPYAHARIVSIDVSAAEAAPRVLAVATAEQLADTTGHVPVQFTPRNPGEDPPPHPLLATGKVRYVGEPVALVVAEERAAAEDAAELVRVQYEPLPVVVDPHDALKDEVLLHEALGTNVLFRTDDRAGDLDDAFRRADRIVEGTYRSQRICPAPMETRGVVAAYDVSDDMLTVWSATQSAHHDQQLLAYVLRRDRSSIRVIAPEVGGGFGGKDLRTDVAAVCHMAVRLGRPIKWIEGRGENMTSYHGRGMECRAEAAVLNDGTILGIRFQAIADIGAYFIRSTSTPSHHLARRIAGPYKTPVIHMEMNAVATNKPTTGPYRGSGAPEAAYFMERTIDLIAGELGMDPLEVRRQNLIPADQLPFTTPTGLTYDSGDYLQALQRALELADYEGLRQEQKQARAQGRLVGLGIASFLKSQGGGGELMDSTARVEIDRAGAITIYTEASPHGQGTDTSFAQIAADTLGVQPQDVVILHGDTDVIEDGVGTMASRALTVSGSAVYDALENAHLKLAQIAAHLLGCAESDVQFGEGRAWAAGRLDDSCSFTDVAAAAHNEETLPPGVSPGLDFEGSFHLPDYVFPSGAQLALVEVDRDTGEVNLLRCVGVHDCGTIINPVVVEGQTHGGLAQGIGQAMTEDVLYTDDGQPLMATFQDYGMPHAEDMPEMVMEHMETPTPMSPLGTKGMGSLVTVGPPAAVSNAVADALSPLGIRHVDTPYTAYRIWSILNSVEQD
jgi:carbon-monoxide dehydrogenase large subunit